VKPNEQLERIEIYNREAYLVKLLTAVHLLYELLNGQIQSLLFQ